MRKALILCFRMESSVPEFAYDKSLLLKVFKRHIELMLSPAHQQYLDTWAQSPEARVKFTGLSRIMLNV